MGAKMTALTTSLYGRDCKVDADCYPSSLLPLVATASTAADKAKRCCILYNVVKAPSGTGADVANVALALTAANYGFSVTAGTVSKGCAFDYPSAIALTWPVYVAAGYGTWSGSEYVANSTNGGAVIKNYCDGGAATLAIASVAAVAVASSVY